jgi:DNA polymerase-3 subunit alpha
MAANMHRDYPELKNGRKELTYLHPDLEPILGDTYGLMLYQESVMRVAQKFAGYTLEEADNLRKACGKKIRQMIQKERVKFVQGCAQQGYGEALGSQLFDIIEPFADYAFGKSHSYGYGLVAYQTAWLKANYPVEYLAALLSSVKDDKDRMAVYLAECRVLGIEVRVPDINESVSHFSAKSSEQLIVFGLAGVRNVGEAVVDLIVSERDANGPFADFYDFCKRVDPLALNKRGVESLIKAGAFDSCGHSRQGLCLVFEEIIDRSVARRREEDLGISTLFSLLEAEARANGEDATSYDDSRLPIAVDDFKKGDKLAFEKEMLGLYVSDHPLRGLELALRREAPNSIRDVLDAESAPSVNGHPETNGAVVTGGVVTGLSRRYTRRGELMATFVLEDLDAAIEVMVFPKAMMEYGGLLEDDAIVVVKGRSDNRDEQPKLVAMAVRRPELVPSEPGSPIEVTLPLTRLTDTMVRQLRDLVTENPGPSPVLLRLGEKMLRLPPQFNVDPRGGIIGALKELFGTAAVAS